MEDPRLLGDWDLGLREFSIVEGPDGTRACFPEAPPGFEARLVACGEARFRLEGGPYPGAELVIDETGRVTVGGFIPVTPLDHPAAVLPGWGLAAPPTGFDRAEVVECERTWARLDHPSGGPDVELGDLAPHRFVQWLMAEDLVIFHGSNRTDLGELRPVRQSMEVADQAGRGNRGAVYGTHDGLWAMFFSVIDRGRLEGSIRNGVDTHVKESGETIDLYHFSVNQESLATSPFTTGALYLLPRAGFGRLPLYPGGPASAEWGCPDTVRPLARLRIRPEDFPFLDGIGAHDDGPLLEYTREADRVFDSVVAAEPIEGGVKCITGSDRDSVTRMIDLGRRFFPDVSVSVEDHPDGLALTLTGPPAFETTVRSRLAELLEKSTPA